MLCSDVVGSKKVNVIASNYIVASISSHRCESSIRQWFLLTLMGLDDRLHLQCGDEIHMSISGGSEVAARIT